MATGEPSASGSATAEDEEPRRSFHIGSLPLVDFRLLSQSELYSLSLSASPAPQRCQDDVVIPKIDRSVFNESAGSRKQTFSRLRLAPRGQQPSKPDPRPVPAAHIPLDEENSQIIAMLQHLFNVESLRTAGRDGGRGEDASLVPVQVEFKQPEPNALTFQNIPIDVVDDGSTVSKRKRGRPRKNESSAARVVEEAAAAAPPKKEEGEGFVEDGGLDPFGEEVKRRTVGLETEAQLVEFMEGMKGEWRGQRKKKRTVETSDVGPFLPSGWKVELSLMKRGGRASIVCRRYVSPYGHQFVSFKEVSAYLLSFYGEDINLVKSSYTDGSRQFPSNINVASGSRVVGHVTTGDTKTDAGASCMHLTSTSVHSHHDKQATVSSSIGIEKPNTSHGNFNNSLSWGCKLADTTSGAFGDFDHQIEDKQPMMNDKNNANTVQGFSLDEDRVHSQKMVDNIENSEAACNLYIPLVFPTPFPNDNSGINQLSDETNAGTCIKSDISNFASESRNTGCHETALCGNEQAHVDNNGHGLSAKLVEDYKQILGFRSSTLSPNSKDEKFASSNLEDRHLISPWEYIEISEGNPAKDDKQHNISCCDQSEIRDGSINVKLQSSSDGISHAASLQELKRMSMNSSDRIQTFMLKDSAVGKCFDSDLPIDERTCDPSGYALNVFLSTCTKGASGLGGVDIAPNLPVAKDVNDNHAPPNEDLVTICAQETNSLNDQNCKVDNLFHKSSKSNLLTGDEHPSVFYDILNNNSAGTFGAQKAVDAGWKKPQLGIVSCSNDAAVDAYTNASIMQGRSEGSDFVASGSSVSNLLDKQSNGSGNSANKSCLSEHAKSEQVDILQTTSTGMPDFR